VTELLPSTTKVIHWRIAKAAKAIAAEAYEVMAREDAFYRMWRDPKLYVRRNWQHYIPFARQALIDILGKDYKNEIAMGVYTAEAVEKMKEEVYEVILIDSAGRKPASGIYETN
jgi:hypothetical protein